DTLARDPIDEGGPESRGGEAAITPHGHLGRGDEPGEGSSDRTGRFLGETARLCAAAHVVCLEDGGQVDGLPFAEPEIVRPTRPSPTRPAERTSGSAVPPRYRILSRTEP